jgi:hypothetical protein
MTVYELSRLFHDTYCDEKIRMKYRADRLSVLANYDLTEKELEAVQNVDIKRIYQMKVHPLLVWHFAVLEGMSSPKYVELISDK